MSVRVSYKKQFVVGILLLIIFLGIVEAYANLWWMDIQKCSFINSEVFKKYDKKYVEQLCTEHYKLRGTTDYFVFPDQNLTTIHINSLGFRGPEFNPIKPAGVYRIFVIGGSTTFGSGASSDNTTISGYLQDLLDNDHPKFKVEVINGGYPNRNTLYEKKLIVETIINLEPDMIIMYDGVNDLRADYTKTMIKNNWNDVCDLSKIDNFTSIFILQPINGFGKKIYTTQERINSLAAFDDNGYRMINKKPLYDQYWEALKELSNNCPHTYDFRDIFENVADPIYWDDAHMIDEGNKIVATEIYKIISPIVKNSKPVSNNEMYEHKTTKIEPINETKLTYHPQVQKSQFREFLSHYYILLRNAISYYKTPIMIHEFLNKQV